MLVDKLVKVCLDCKDKFLFIGDFIHEGFEFRIIDLFEDADFSGIDVDKCVKVNGVVADALVGSCCAVFVGVCKIDHVDAAVLDLVCGFK